MQEKRHLSDGSSEETRVRTGECAERQSHRGGSPSEAPRRLRPGVTASLTKVLRGVRVTGGSPTQRDRVGQQKPPISVSRLRMTPLGSRRSSTGTSLPSREDARRGSRVRTQPRMRERRQLALGIGRTSCWAPRGNRERTRGGCSVGAGAVCSEPASCGTAA